MYFYHACVRDQVAFVNDFVVEHQGDRGNLISNGPYYKYNSTNAMRSLSVFKGKS